MGIEYILRWSIAGTAVLLLTVFGAMLFSGRCNVNAYLGCRETLSRLNGFARRFAERYIDVACGLVLLIFGAIAAAEMVALNLTGVNVVVFAAVFFPTVALSAVGCVFVSRLRLKSLLDNVRDNI